ncbi:MAG: hypothetical protein WAK55_26135 [Xanthobacteraceae bacterium]
MVKARRFSGVKTKPSVLESLPQFQPETNFDIDHIEPETGEYRAFSATRQAELSQILNERIWPHLQKFEQKGQEARLKRFLKAALSAIATYEHQREEQASFDRVEARKIVLAAHMAVWDARSALLGLAKDRHLSRFLERVFTHQKAKIASPETSALRQRDVKKDLARQIEESEKSLRSYRALNPNTVADQLSRLEPCLMLAAERLLFQPGDMQRDYIARTFTDMMASAWMEATEKIPSYAKPSLRSRNPSPFTSLLDSINKGFLRTAYQSKNNFRDYASASIKQLRRNFPDRC